MTNHARPQDTTEIPEVPPDKRNSLWNACYASAFMAAYQNLRLAAWNGPTRCIYTIDEFIKCNAIGTAEQAKTLADTAVWALEEFDKSERDS